MNFCDFSGNDNFDIRAEACSDPNSVIDARYNYWVYNDSASIADSCISDHLDDPEAPTVDFMPFMSQPGVAVIAGTVTDDSLNPIEGVIVDVVGEAFTDTTDINGEYMLSGLAMGYCDISFSHDLYEDSVFGNLFAVMHDTASVDMVLFECHADDYVTGDVNANGIYNGLDITYGVGYLKGGSPPPFSCDCPPHGIWFISGDVNGSCSYNGLDITYGVSYLKGGVSVLIPCPDCPPAGP